MKTERGVATEEMEVDALGKSFLLSCTPIYDEQGKLDKINSTASDISQCKKMELQLRSSERQLRAILENIALIAIMLDQEGNILFCNDHFLDFTGWQRHEIMQSNWFTTFIPEDIRDHLFNTLFRKMVKHSDFPIYHQNEILLRITSIPPWPPESMPISQ